MFFDRLYDNHYIPANGRSCEYEVQLLESRPREQVTSVIPYGLQICKRRKEKGQPPFKSESSITHSVSVIRENLVDANELFG
jgi:hypothetical protein